jgi:hypothetical protein
MVQHLLTFAAAESNYTTLDSGINIGVRLSIFGLFSRGYVLIREGNAYCFSKFPLFDGTYWGCLF